MEKQKNGRCLYNTILLLKGERQYSIGDFKKFTAGDTIFGDCSDPIELKRWTAEGKTEAEELLNNNYKCKYDYGDLQEMWYVTEYALEYAEYDEDGDFMDSFGFNLAPED